MAPRRLTMVARGPQPQALQGTVLDDHFDLVFVGLPHKVYETEKFLAAVSDLRAMYVYPSPMPGLLEPPQEALIGGRTGPTGPPPTRFLDRSHPRYLMNKIYRKGVPADGFAHYAAGVWVRASVCSQSCPPLAPRPPFL